MKKHSVISFFSGCGGLDLGLIGGFSYLGKQYKKNPFKIILSNDINEKATLTQKHNFSDINVVCGDVTKLVENNLPYADILIGGFPCQDFSLAGKQRGLEVERGNLYKAMVTALKKIKPKVFLAENVKGLLLWKNGLAINTIVNDFEECGYSVVFKLLNAADYGVPQTRERVIIVGIRNDIKRKFKWPEPTHSNMPLLGLTKWVSVEEAIRDLEDEKIATKIPNHQYSKAKKNNGQGNKAVVANLPSPTMRAEHHGNIEFHYKLPRRLSAREAARIQSFPDNFVFLRSTTDAYRQIGNAVAPVFAWHIAQSLLEILETKEEYDELKKCI
ncbi:MAG: DNA cytosine methyltransferase [Firmicutes bacterium]|nr:DNA cytosine methyltransferase [Bacillota bacterium]